MRLPAVVVGDHAESGEGDFCFAGEFGLRDVGHADEVEAKLAVSQGFCAGGEGGAVHIDVGACLVNGDSRMGGAVDEDLAQVFAVGVCKGDMGDKAVSEKGVVFSATGAVVVLIGHQNMTGSILFLEAADSSDADDEAYAKGAQGPDIGAMIDLGGKETVATGVAREKDDLASGEGALHEDVRGRAIGSVDGQLFEVFEAFELVEATASNDADHGWIEFKVNGLLAARGRHHT